MSTSAEVYGSECSCHASAADDGWGSSSPGGAPEDLGCYRLARGADGKITGFDARYFMCGGKIYEGPDGTPRAGFAALSIPCQGDDDPSGATVEFYGTFAELKAAGADYTKYTIPLYKFDEDDDGNVTVAIDFRNMPSAAMGEAGL